MPSPITWRNINSPNFSASNTLRQQSLAGLDRGLASLANLSKQVNDANVQRNTDEVLAQIRGINTLEDLAAAREAGTFDRTNFASDAFDVNAIDRALSGREGQIRKDIVDTANFQDFQRKQAEAPERARISNLIASNQFDEARDAIGSSDIRDTSALSNALKSTERSEIQFNRQEDAYQDTQQITGLLHDLNSSRETNIAEIQRLNSEFAANNRGISFDGSGNPILDPNLTDTEKADLQRRYNESVATIKPSVLKDSQQHKFVNELAKQRNINPTVVKQAKAALTDLQNERKSLTPEQQQFLTAAQNDRQIQDKAVFQQIDDIYQQTLRDHPVNIPSTTKNEKIKVGDVINQIGIDLQKDSATRNDESKEAVDAINRIARKGKYPGWAIQEAYRRTGGAVGIIDHGFLTESVELDAFESNLKEVMELHAQDEKNKKVLDDAKALRDTQLLKRQQETMNYLSGQLKRAKARSGVFNLDNASPATLDRSINRLRQR